MSSSVSSESIQGTTTTTTTTISRQPKQQHNPQHQQATTMQQLYPASGLLALAAAAATGGGETTGFTLSPHVPLPVPQAVSAQPGSIPHHQVLMHQQQFLFPDRFSVLQNDDNGKLSIPYLLNQAAASQLAKGMHNQFQAAPAGLPFPGRGWLPPSSNESNDTGRPTGPFPFAIPMLQPRHPSSSSSGPLRVVGAPQVAQPNGAETASVGKSQQQQQAGTTISSSNASSSRYSPAVRRPSDSWSSGASSPNPNAKRGQSPGLSSGGAPSDDDDGDYIDDSESEDGKANLRHKSGLSPIGPIKKKRASQHQVSVLEQFFATDPLPTSGSQRALAEALGMTQRSVQLWFQNKRAKLRRMGKTITPKQKGITFHHFSVANNGKLRMVNEEGSADLHGIL